MKLSLTSLTFLCFVFFSATTCAQGYVVAKDTLQSLNSIECGDGSSCLSDQTCCPDGAGGYGCCPTPGMYSLIYYCNYIIYKTIQFKS